MRFLHTSDWHLGRSLYGKKRYVEFSQFLDWLLTVIEQQSVDLLIIAGDVFDTSMPTNRVQELYYRFLCRVSASCCRHVIVVAGNHDSPSFLDAPGELLRSLNVYVVGSVSESLEDEVMVLYHGEAPQAIVCAVPYLRDRDIRTAEPGETIDDKNAKLVDGVRTHYQEVCGIARKKQEELSLAGYDEVPVIATGHLFTAGGKTVDGDGVRELYVGSLAHVEKDVFPSSIDYLALGHLHIPQVVRGLDHIRYSGSPIPMGYGEARQQKLVLLGEFTGRSLQVKELPVPCFQQLLSISGSLETILSSIGRLKEQQSSAWLEIEYTGGEVIPDLRDLIDESLQDSDMEIRRIKNSRIIERMTLRMEEDETLDDLNEHDVFTRCLETFQVPQEQWDELTAVYRELVQSINETDLNA